MSAPLPDLPAVPLPVTPPKSPRLCPVRKTKSLTFSPYIENGPISPKEAIENYSSLLMPYEIPEIQLYIDVYFLGYPDAKNASNVNYYDNINPKDQIAYRYEVIKILGSGSFGKVVEAIDHKMKRKVAIKILIDAELSKTEAGILATLNRHRCSNAIKGLDYFLFRTHACISFELLGPNLYSIQYKNNFVPQNLATVKNYAIQIFRGLRDCAKLGIIHCDLKPENICTVIDDANNIKIIDFGSSSYEDKYFRSYIQSRYYRSPEVILRLKYGPKIDVWSAALIIIELLTGRPVFPGKNELDMLNLMVELLGPVPRTMINSSKKKKFFFNDDLSLKCGTSMYDPLRKKTNNLKNLIGSEIASPQLIDFLDRCLTWKPNLRMSALDALDHPWLQQKNSTESEGLPCLQK